MTKHFHLLIGEVSARIFRHKGDWETGKRQKHVTDAFTTSGLHVTVCFSGCFTKEVDMHDSYLAWLKQETETEFGLKILD